MPRTNTSGVSNAGPVEEAHVSLADGTLKEVNDMPKEEKSSPGNSSAASSKSSETMGGKRARTSR